MAHSETFGRVQPGCTATLKTGQPVLITYTGIDGKGKAVVFYRDNHKARAEYLNKFLDQLRELP